MHRRFLLCSIFILSIFIHHETFCSHLRAGEITVKRSSCTALTFRITITVYIDTESRVTFGGNEDFLQFGDGDQMLVPVQQTISRPDLGKNMGMASFTVDHTYSAVPRGGVYTIRYFEPFRNEGIVNMDVSGATLFYVETAVYIDPFLSCNDNLPELTVPPIDRACQGVAFFHNPGAFDRDGDSLSYEMSIPKRANSSSVINYKDPNNAKFYLDYSKGNEDADKEPLFTINAQDGTLKWDAPGKAGEYNVAFLIIEWRKDPTGVWRKLSSVTRDMQIIVDDCKNQRPDLIIPNDTCIVAGSTLEKMIYGIDQDNDDVKIEIFSEILHIRNSPATYSPRPPIVQPSVPSAQLYFLWNTECDHIKEQYYQVVFKITDYPITGGTKLVTFKTWRIKVVGPPPEWKEAKARTDRSVTLKWNTYECPNATTMQVWRRVDNDIGYSPANCETGIPAFLGYTLVENVPVGTSINSFTDTNNRMGLAPGAMYCYRLVAVFPEPKGGESYVSEEICLEPLPMDAPVITNVTVEKTHAQEGNIRISWWSPLDLERAKFPGPYQYEVLRASDFTGNDLIRATSAARITDTTFVDSMINTENKVYNYRVVLYSNSADNLTEWNAIDTSAVASSVRLEVKSETDKIFLRWKAVVPWSNISAKYPYHLIFRGTKEMKDSDFILIDSVAIRDNNFTYTDAGQYNNIPLDKESTYCYRVLTRGVYGNFLLNEPFENYSQVICSGLNNDEKPCAPVLSLMMTNCDEIFASSGCMVKNFSNTLKWTIDCSMNIRSYNIYSSAGPDVEFVLLAKNVLDTFFIDTNLPSFARCYAITSVDAQGNESERSDVVCRDNCPYFELPNIFTPNGDECNDYFSAYGPWNPLIQDSPEFCMPGNENYTRCIRFVDKVSFKVYNRWGKEVYVYKSGKGESSIYINWDGKDNEGQLLSSGVYYYQALVTFNSLKSIGTPQLFKGWVQLIR